MLFNHFAIEFDCEECLLDVPPLFWLFGFPHSTFRCHALRCCMSLSASFGSLLKFCMSACSLITHIYTLSYLKIWEYMFLILVNTFFVFFFVGYVYSNEHITTKFDSFIFYASIVSRFCILSTLWPSTPRSLHALTTLHHCCTLYLFVAPPLYYYTPGNLNRASYLFYCI